MKVSCFLNLTYVHCVRFVIPHGSKLHFYTNYIVISLLLLTACSSENKENLGKYINKNVDKIKIIYGKNGEQIVITNANEMNELVQYFESINVYRVDSSSYKDLKGYSYKLDLINGEKILNTIMFIGDILQVDNKYYESKNEIYTNILQELMTK